jgi:hypothetical protein
MAKSSYGVIERRYIFYQLLIAGQELTAKLPDIPTGNYLAVNRLHPSQRFVAILT